MTLSALQQVEAIKGTLTKARDATFQKTLQELFPKSFISLSKVLMECLLLCRADSALNFSDSRAVRA